MSRPGFTLDVDERTQPLLVAQGTRLRLERFGLGTHVVYPGDGRPVGDPTPLVAAALASPLGTAPLAAQLHAGMALTIVVGDLGSPRPRMGSDVRRHLVEQVLVLAAAAGVDDVAVLCANGLAKRPSDAELTDVVGERVVRSFASTGGLLSTDATDPAYIDLGVIDGHEIRLHPRIAASDLVVNIVVTSSWSTSAGRQLVALTDVATLDWALGLETSSDRVSAVIGLVEASVATFTLDAALGEPVLPDAVSFLGRREWEWRVRDQVAFATARQALAVAPKQAIARLFSDLAAGYPVLGVAGGARDQVHASMSTVWTNAVAVQGPPASDVGVVNVWRKGSLHADPASDPLGAAHHAVAEQPSLVEGGQLVRPGGVLVGFHPLSNRFSSRTNSVGADFFAEVLPASTDPTEIRATFQDRFSTDPWYGELYRGRHGHHPLLTFHRWYATARAAATYADVVWVGADRRSAELMGFRAASTYADALEIASGHVGRTPSITVLHGGGGSVVRVP